MNDGARNLCIRDSFSPSRPLWVTNGFSFHKKKNQKKKPDMEKRKCCMLDIELTCARGPAGSVGGQHGGRLGDGQIVAVDGDVELGGLGVDEAKVGGGDGLGEEQEGLCCFPPPDMVWFVRKKLNTDQWLGGLERGLFCLAFFDVLDLGAQVGQQFLDGAGHGDGTVPVCLYSCAGRGSCYCWAVVCSSVLCEVVEGEAGVQFYDTVRTLLLVHRARVPKPHAS